MPDSLEREEIQGKGGEEGESLPSNHDVSTEKRRRGHGKKMGRRERAGDTGGVEMKEAREHKATRV